MKHKQLIKLFKCGICSFSSSDIHSLETHSLSSHVCEYCYGQFYSKLHHKCKKDPKLIGAGRSVTQSDSRTRNDDDAGPSSPSVNIPDIFEKVSGSFRDSICTYRFVFKDDFPQINEAIASIHSELYTLVASYVKYHTGIRIKLAMELLFEDMRSKSLVTKRYPAPNLKIPHVSFIEPIVADSVNYVSALCEILGNDISGLVLIKCLSIYVTILKYVPMAGNGRLPLGPFKKKRGIINTRVTKNCFLASVLLCIYANESPLSCGKTYVQTKGKEREKARRLLESKAFGESLVKKNPLQYSDLRFGHDLSLMSLVEEKANIGISVYRWSSKLNGIITIRSCDTDYPKHVSLLMLLRSHLPVHERKKYSDNIHFCSIVDRNTFFNIKRKKSIAFCEKCSTYYRNIDHKTTCQTSQNRMYKFPAQSHYRFTELHRCLVPRTTLFFNFLFANENTCTSKINLTVIGYGIVGIDDCSNVLFSDFFIGENSIERFFDVLLLNCEYYLDLLVKNQLPLVATKAERLHMKSLVSCFLCGRDFDRTQGIYPVINHHHHLEQKYVNHNFPCVHCNLKYFCLRKIVAFTHGINLSAKSLLDNLSDTAIKQIHLIPKTGQDSLLGIIFKHKIALYDSENHLHCSLHEAMKITGLEEFSIMKKSEPENYKLLVKHLPFPHKFVHSVSDLQKAMPDDFADFFDATYNVSEQKKAFKKAIKLYSELGCTNLLEYAYHHLKSSTFGLADVMNSYSRFVYKHFAIQPLTDISISSFGSACNHFVSQANYEHLKDENIHQIIRQNLIGGLSISAQKYVACKSLRLGNERIKPSDEVECIYFDFNKQHAFLLGEPTPHSNYKFFTPDETSNFSLSDIKNEDTHYILCVDLLYVDSIKEATKYFPLCPSRTQQIKNTLQNYNLHASTTLSNDKTMGTGKVVLDQRNKTKVWLGHKNLLLFVKMGMELTKIHNVISYTVKPQFRIFRETCQNSFADAKNKLHGQIIKAIANHSVGWFMSRCINENVKICTTEKQATKLLSRSNFSDAVSIKEDLACISMLRKRSLQTKNILVAFHVLEGSKLMLYETYYNRLFPLFRNRLSLVLAETDSLLIKISGRHPTKSLYDELKELNDIIDYSRVPSYLTEIYDTSKSNFYGLLRIESLAIRSVVSLRGKQFSIKEVASLMKCDLHATIDCSLCTLNSRHIMKGVRKVDYTHEKFLNILNHLDNGVSSYTCVGRKGAEISVVDKNRCFASLCSGDRILINRYDTIPVGYLERQ